ncbi:MAG: 50S ribosomal protein L18 [Methanosarcinales archaeon]|nr:MAG: 50S ribosomal protein L18 [Methanosarcinales archaeon]
MATSPRYKVPFKRRRAGRTNYHRRLRLLLSKKPRMVVRKSTRHTRIQLALPGNQGDNILSSATSLELKNYGYSGSSKNTTAAYLTGLLFGYRTIGKGFTEGVLDMGLHPSTFGSRCYAALRGAVDAGMDIPHNPVVFPTDERVRGEMVAEYTGSDLPAIFEATKAKITSEFGGT